MKTLIAAAALTLSLSATPIANAQGPAAPAFCGAFHPTTHYITACAHGPGDTGVKILAPDPAPAAEKDDPGCPHHHGTQTASPADSPQDSPA
jgi:hypothetical protein